MAVGQRRANRSNIVLPLFLLVAVASLAVVATGLPGSELVYPIAGLAAILGLAVGIRVHRPPTTGPWRMLLASAVTTIGNQVGFLAAGSPRAGLGTILFGLVSLLAMGFEIAALLVFVRKRLPGEVVAVVLDGGVFALSVWLMMLPLIVQPVLAAGGAGPAVIIQTLYFPLDAALVFVAAMLVFCDRGRVVAVLVLAATLTLQLAGDFAYGLAEAGRISVSDIPDLLYIASLFCLGLTALHPSMRRLSDPQARVRSRDGVARVWILAPLFVAGVEAVTIAGPHTTRERVTVGVSLALLVGTLLARVHHTVRLNVRTQQALVVSARHDPLTGLPTRSLAEEQLTDAANAGWRPSANVAVMIINVDRLERVNDTFGHDAGDELLQAVARRVESSAPFDAVVARIAGDEFCVGLPTVNDEAEATTLAASILASFQEPFAISVGKVFSTASIGVAVAPLVEVTATTELFRDADTALRRAKETGHSGLVQYDRSMRDQARHRLELENALRSAVRNDEFLLHHQPIVDVRTGLVTGFEALVRWQRPGVGLVPPMDFIPIAEETGLISPLGAWVMRQGLVELRDWIDRRACTPYTRMSINASARQLRDHDFVGIVDEALRHANLPPSQLWVEITETAILADMDASLDTVRRLRSLGVRIALDDFGTGYSSLSHLRKFPIDRIKIDRSFVSSLESNADDRSLVGSILVLARELGKDVVAEGVETAEQLAILAKLGCPKAQGYYFSRPLPAAELLDRLPAIELTGAPAAR